jgi:hypothetical protein
MIERLLRSQSRAFVLIAMAMAVAGLVAALSMPIGLFPQVSFPRVVVDLDSGSRPASQTALTVTRPVEEAIRAVPGVQNVRSETSRGSAQISVDFGWGRDMVASTLLIDSAIARVVPTLPAGTAYDVRRMDPTVFPIISYALVSNTADPVALQDLARYQITPLLSSISGLARVGVQGGETGEVQVLADPHRLADHNLAMSDLVNAIRDGNVLSAVWFACAMSPPCRMAECRNGNGSSRMATPPSCSTSMNSPTAMQCKSPSRFNRSLPDSSFRPTSNWSTGTTRASSSPSRSRTCVMRFSSAWSSPPLCSSGSCAAGA